LSRCIAVVTPANPGGTPGSSACRGSGTVWHDDEKSKEHCMPEWLHGRAWRKLTSNEDVGIGACKYAGEQRRALKIRPAGGRVQPRVFGGAGLN
jgi:hypothetical protein